MYKIIMETIQLGELQEELNFYRRNQSEMEQEVTTLIGDNQKLSQQVGMLLKEKLENDRNTHITNNIDSRKEIDELKGQVNLLAKERDSLHVLWQTSQKTIEALETELKTYQTGLNQNTQQSSRDLEIKFESALSDYIELESKHKELQTKHSIIENQLKQAEIEISSYNERGKELNIKVEELSKDLNEHKLNLAVERKNNEMLKDQVLLQQKECADLVKKEAEAKSKASRAAISSSLAEGKRSLKTYQYKKKISDCTNETEQLLHKSEYEKNLSVWKLETEALCMEMTKIFRNSTRVSLEKLVAEALQLFDLVFAQKNEAYEKIRTITGEINELKQLLDNVKRNAETSYRRELDEIKEKYNEKIVDMLQHIKNLDSELSEKGLLLNKALREVKVLQAANEDYVNEHKESVKALNPKLAVAEQKLEVMFQELVLSERRNIQMECEKQCLAIDIQRMQDVHTREIKRRDWEEKLLKNQCQELKLQVEHLQKSLEETHTMVNKLQNMISSRDELNQKMLANKEVEIEELNKHLHNQMELSKKWKQSYIEMSEKLKGKLQYLEKENRDYRIKLKLPTGTSSPEESVAS